MCRPVESELRIFRDICGRHSVHVVQAQWAEVEKETCVHLSPGAIVSRELQFRVTSVDGTVNDGDRKPEHIDSASIAGRDVRCYDDSRKLRRVMADRIHVFSLDAHIFLAEFPAEVEGQRVRTIVNGNAVCYALFGI